MAGGIRYRKRIAIIRKHLYLNISRSQTKGWAFSWTVKAFGVSHNLNRKKTTVDLPGGLYYEGKGGKGSRKGSAKGSRTATPPPYRGARWPYPVLAVLLVLGVIGGAVWQSIVLFGGIAVVVFLVQHHRASRAGTPAHRDTGEPAPVAEPDDEAERIVRDWNPPKGWSRDA